MELATLRKILDPNKGKFRLESRGEKATTLFFWFPQFGVALVKNRFSSVLHRLTESNKPAPSSVVMVTTLFPLRFAGPINVPPGGLRISVYQFP